MKKILIKTLIVCTVVLLLPFLLTLLLSKQNDTRSLGIQNFQIYYKANGTEEELDFEKYIMGVVAANMPAGYNMEALKAQAVIARTYALYNISLLSEDSNHNNQYTTSELGLTYISLSSLEQYWGTKDYLDYFSKIENAVYGTQGEIMMYQDSLVLPVFFDTSCGFTRNAKEAWGVDIPYLESVPSKQDVTSTHYLKIKEESVASVIDTLEKAYQVTLTEDNFFQEVTVTERDSADYVTKMNLGDLSVSGEEFAKVLGLSSNHFYIDNYDGNVRIICNGVGHGVGMSQYGANAMAVNGSHYKDILTYYYTGVQLASLDEAD